MLRQLEGFEGEVEVETLYEPRPEFGRLRPSLERRGALGLRCEIDGTSLTLRSELPLELTDGARGARGISRIRSGERKYLSLTYSTRKTAILQGNLNRECIPRGGLPLELLDQPRLLAGELVTVPGESSRQVFPHLRQGFQVGACVARSLSTLSRIVSLLTCERHRIASVYRDLRLSGASHGGQVQLPDELPQLGLHGRPW